MVTAIFYSGLYNNIGLPLADFHEAQSMRYSGENISSFFLNEGESYQMKFDGSFVPNGAQNSNGQYYPAGTIDYMRFDFSQETGKTFEIFDMDITTQEYLNTLSGVEMSSNVFGGDDNIQGSTEADTLLGFGGNDFIIGSATDANTDAGDVLLGNGGSDVIYGMAGNDSIVGGSELVDDSDGDDRIIGGTGDDRIYGSGGNDFIDGGADDDLIVGGAGKDILKGGAGNDIFVFIENGGYDTVLDYAVNDTLTIQRTATIQGFEDIAANSISDQFGSFIDLGAGNGITLANVQISDLAASDFYFYG
jgi:Ca2+-binding RTX toxin-like protein